MFRDGIIIRFDEKAIFFFMIIWDHFNVCVSVLRFVFLVLA